MIAEVLYYIFIYPMQTLLGAVFEWIYAYTHSYGWAIVLLSVAINLFLLKLTNLADKKAQKTNALKSICDTKIAEFKKVFRGSELHAYTQTLFKQKHYHPIYNLFSLGGLALQIPFFLGVLFLLQDFEGLRGAKFGVIEDLSKPDTLLFGYALLPFVMSALSFISVFISSTDRGARIQGSLIAIIFLVLLYAMPSGLVLYWTISTLCILCKLLWKKQVSSIRNAKADTSLNNEQNKSAVHKEFDTHAKQSSFVGRFVTRIFTPYAMLDSKTYVTYRNISIFALLNIFFLIFIFSPFAVYSSDVSQFDPNQTFQTLGGLFGFFLLFSFLGIYITSFFYKTPLLKIGVYACVVLILISISYVFLFTGNIFNGRPYALLDGLLFKDGGANISHPYAKYFDIAYAFFLMFVALIMLYKFTNLLRMTLLFVFGIFLISSVLDLGRVFVDHSHYAQLEVHTRDSIEDVQNSMVPDYADSYLSFSKTKQNIIVLMSDTVQSDNFTQALNDYPELYEVFDGFTYYKNALSASSITFASFPSIIGGEYYTPYNVNKRELKHTLAEENSKAIVDIANSFSNAGYAVSFGTIFPGDEVYIRPYLNKDVLLIPNTDHSAWSSFYKQYYHIKEPDLDSAIPFGELISLGLFRASPYIFRSRLYQSEGWLFGDSLLVNHFRYSVNNASKIASFAVLSNINSPKPTFKLFHENTEHFPWLLDKDNNCMHITDPSIYRSRLMSDKSGLAYSNHICYVKNLASWLQWFKDSGIYDNTKIIIVSDHGNGGHGAPLIDFPRRELRNSHIFFLVKEFGAKGKLKIDDTTFVSNSDAMAVACDEINSECPRILPSVIRKPMLDRELIFTLVDGGSGRQTNTKFDIILQYKVKNNIFDLNNWTDITNIQDKER